MDLSFTCADCNKAFSISESARAKYPNWTPKQCMDCRGKGGTSKATRPGRGKPVAPASADGLGPQSGIFTDGSCQGNPGPGGWGVVWVSDGEVIAERHGFDPATTNNRMELTGVIEGLLMAPTDEPITLFTDSNLVVNTITKWAAGWEKLGWKRREGPVKNLDLVQRAYALSKERPNVKIEWVPGHSGYTWNERADVLSTEHLRAGREV
jgi:ribonuclease HI